MVRANRIVHVLVACTLSTLAGACAPGPGADDPSRWYGAPGNGAPASDDEDTDASEDTDGDSKADSDTEGSAGESSGGSSGPPSGDSDDPGATSSDDGTSGADTSGNEVLDACLGSGGGRLRGVRVQLVPRFPERLRGRTPGCVAIRSCAQQSGCTDTLSCYEACESVIDMHGGALGSSGTLAAELSECMENSCAVCFS